jgi:hypothetical protein
MLNWRLIGPQLIPSDVGLLLLLNLELPIPSFLNTSLFVLAAAVVGTVQGSFFEWAYHRYWLHRPWLPPQMFTAHTLVHHQLCKHDDTFHVHDEEQEEALTFQWWGGPLLVALNLVPWLGVWWALSAAGVVFPYLACLITIGATILVYYSAYEGFHYLMHRPAIGWIERSRPFRFLERHHRLHHVHMGKNFNVVFPLADLSLGTLILRDNAPPTRTSPAAREVARRHSRFGRRLREQEAADQLEGAEPQKK